MTTSLSNVRRYGLTLRPDFPVERGSETGSRYVNGGRGTFPHGWVEYDRPLPDFVIGHWSMVPYWNDASTAVTTILDIVTPRLRYLREYEDDDSLSPEGAVIRAAESFMSDTGVWLFGQFKQDDMSARIRAEMIRRGMFVPLMPLTPSTDACTP